METAICGSSGFIDFYGVQWATWTISDEVGTSVRPGSPGLEKHCQRLLDVENKRSKGVNRA